MLFVLPAPVARALDLLEAAGHAAYVVGGCVRDWALGMTPHDYDICTSAVPEEMKRIFRGEKTVETGIRHGTLTVIMMGMPLEITAFRVDGDYEDGRHPSSVRFTDRIEEDLSRRDFTVNAMAYSPARGLVDPFGGRRDCQDGVIRCVGEPDRRFEEDALRILRALRFSARLGFPVEETTAASLRRGRERLGCVSRERIAAELTGLLLGKEAGRVLAAYPEVLAAAVPELRPLTESPSWALTARRVAAAPPWEDVRWAALLMNGAADGGEALARNVLKGLKLPNRITEETAALLRWAGAAVTPGNAQETLMRLGPAGTEALICLQAADGTARGGAQDAERKAAAAREKVRGLMDAGACYTLAQLAVGGRELAELGLRGPGIGETLQELLLRVTRGELPNDREALLAAARKRIGS